MNLVFVNEKQFFIRFKVCDGKRIIFESKFLESYPKSRFSTFSNLLRREIRMLYIYVYIYTRFLRLHAAAFGRVGGGGFPRRTHFSPKYREREWERVREKERERERKRKRDETRENDTTTRRRRPRPVRFSSIFSSLLFSFLFFSRAYVYVCVCMYVCIGVCVCNNYLGVIGVWYSATVRLYI